MYSKRVALLMAVAGAALLAAAGVGWQADRSNTHATPAQPSLPTMVPVYRVLVEPAVVRGTAAADAEPLGMLHQFDFVASVDGGGPLTSSWRHVEGDGWSGYIAARDLAGSFRVPVSRWATLDTSLAAES